MRKFVLSVLLLSAVIPLFAQRDTLTVMVYNLLNFPSAAATPNRQDTLRKILHYTQPDIFMVCELNNATGSNQILNASLNSMGYSNYAAANYVTNRSTTDNHQNMLYFNTQKVALKSQTELLTDLRDINEYVVYFKDPNLSLHNDTTFARLYVTHLKAGTAGTDYTRRNLEAQVLVNYMNGFPSNTNAIFAGDFNTYSSTDACYQTIVNTGTYPFFDPIGMPGAWTNNASFAAIHTQSTRVASFNGGATSGLDDRFDHIVVTEPVITGFQRVKYIPGTYHALGQDGNHYNLAIIDPPANLLIPDSVKSALYYMSDHLPVLMDIEVTFPQLLPVADLDWTAKAIGREVALEMRWNGRIGLREARIERRAWGKSYEPWRDLGALEVGEAMRLVDSEPILGGSSYRVVMVEANGEASVSEERNVMIGGDEVWKVKWMNPAQNGGTYAWIRAGRSGEGWLEVLNLEGQVVKSQQMIWQEGENRYWITLEGIPAGLYVGRVKASDGNAPSVGKIMVLEAQ